MKKQLILAAFFSVVLFGFGFANFAQAEVIPGIDIIVQKKPGGSAITVQTGADGSFNFTGLEAGNYELTAAWGANTPYRSGKEPIDMTINAKGGTDWVIDIFLFTTGDRKPFEPVKFKIGPKGGMVSGTVTLGGTVAETVTSAKIADNSITSQKIIDANVGTLPTSNWYFLKELRRGIAMTFTWNSVKRANLELDILNERAAELQAVANASSTINFTGLERALQNYQKGQERLITKFNNLKENSDNSNVEALLTKLVERTAKHEELFSQIEAGVRVVAADVNGDGKTEIKFSASDEYFNRAKLVRENSVKTIGSAFEKTAGADIQQRAADQIKRAEVTVAELEAAIIGSPEYFGNLRSASSNYGSPSEPQPQEAVHTTRSNIKRPSRVTIDGDNNIYEVGLPGAAINTTRSNIKRPGVAMDADPIPGVDVKLGKNPGGSIVATTTTGANGSYKFTGLSAGKYDLSVGGKLIKTITVGFNGTISGQMSISDQAQAGSLSSNLAISDQAQGGSLSSYLTVSKGHLDDAKMAFAEGNFGKAYGQARSAEVLARNGIRVATGDVNGDGQADINVTPVNDAPTSTTRNVNGGRDVLIGGGGSDEGKITENESPRPVDRKPAEPKPTPAQPKPVELESTTTSLTSSANPSNAGQSVTFTATVSGGAIPTGYITFADGPTSLIDINLNERGVTTFTTSSLIVGTHTIVAIYSGDSTHSSSKGSTSFTVNEVAMGPTSGSPSSGDGSSAGGGLQ